MSPLRRYGRLPLRCRWPTECPPRHHRLEPRHRQASRSIARSPVVALPWRNRSSCRRACHSGFRRTNRATGAGPRRLRGTRSQQRAEWSRQRTSFRIEMHRHKGSSSSGLWRESGGSLRMVLVMPRGITTSSLAAGPTTRVNGQVEVSTGGHEKVPTRGQVEGPALVSRRGAGCGWCGCGLRACGSCRLR